MIETLALVPALTRPDLLAAAGAGRAARAGRGSGRSSGSPSPRSTPTLADTAAFCERYGVPPDESANCVVVAGRRGGEARFAACVVLATTRADVNGVARRRLDVRKASFAPMDVAVAETGMEYGGITPSGCPPDWPLLVDARVSRHRRWSSAAACGARSCGCPGTGAGRAAGHRGRRRPRR